MTTQPQLIRQFASRAKAFETALTNHQAEQDTRLISYIRANEQTAFGIAHDFKRIHSYADYRRQVRPCTHDDLAPWITRLARGEQQILTTEPALRFEETSGSTGPFKWIPYTQSLIHEFADMVAVWLYDLHRHSPLCFSQQLYLSISPQVKRDHTGSRLPVGDGGDLSFFRQEDANLLAQYLVAPLPTSLPPSSFYPNMLERLLNHRLSMISIWSPSFFLELDRHLQIYRPELKGLTWKQIWPDLEAMSCWTHGTATGFLSDVQHRLGNARIDAKGLISTEGIISIPYGDPQLAADPLLALQAHFFEFRSGDQIYRSHELEIDHTYDVLLTTGGGLYRYQTGDQIKVTGFTGDRVPRLYFVGRSGKTSDLVGEKLTEAQVIQALSSASITSVACLCATDQTSYTLFTETDLAAEQLIQFENALRENPYYAQARDLGQLKPLHHCGLPEGMLLSLQTKLANENGIRDGDRKWITLLHQDQLKKIDGLIKASLQEQVLS